MRRMGPLLLLLAVQMPAQAASFLNLDFERGSPGHLPRGWISVHDAYPAALDTERPHAGSSSLRLQSGEGERFGTVVQDFPLADAAGRHLRFSGYIRTADVTGFAGLMWQAQSAKGPPVFDNMRQQGISGDRDWARYELELDIPADATFVNFGVVLTGGGTAWFDDLQIELDGRPYAQLAPVPVVPDAAQLAWLRAHSTPLAAADLVAEDRDLAPISRIAGKALIVGLGEATHGTREFFTLKHRLVRYLVEHEGFTLLAIEASMPDTERVNDYVLHGVGDPAQAVRGMGFWNLETQEMLALVEWLRQYNLSGRGPVQFRGYDCQREDTALDNVEQFVARHDPAYLPELNRHYGRIRRIGKALGGLPRQRDYSVFFETWLESANRVYEHLQKSAPAYRKADRKETAWAIQNARVVAQFAQLEIPGQPTRDALMAENVSWLLSQLPAKGRMLLWAHNAHIGRIAGSDPQRASMGELLGQRYRRDYVPVGLVFHQGAVSVWGRDGRGAQAALPSEAGSLEWALHLLAQPLLLTDLRSARSGTPDSGWLLEMLDQHSYGGTSPHPWFSRSQPAKEFDALVYVETTQAATPLELPRR